MVSTSALQAESPSSILGGSTICYFEKFKRKRNGKAKGWR